jgi:hypothetical protein
MRIDGMIPEYQSLLMVVVGGEAGVPRFPGSNVMAYIKTNEEPLQPSLWQRDFAI